VVAKSVAEALAKAKGAKLEEKPKGKGKFKPGNKKGGGNKEGGGFKGDGNDKFANAKKRKFSDGKSADGSAHKKGSKSQPEIRKGLKPNAALVRMHIVCVLLVVVAIIFQCCFYYPMPFRWKT
jgi:hypothetical protein